MARKKYSKRGKKIEPAEMSMLFTLPELSSPTNRPTIDLSQCASLLNRRFYRQGIQWAVAGFTLHTSQFNLGSLTISKLPSTWIMSNAWEKGFRNWQRMNNEALSSSGSLRPRFLDFKIFANKEHHVDGFGENLIPFIFDDAGARVAAFASAGGWEPSKFVIPLGSADPGDTEEFEVVAVGPSFSGNAPGSGLNCVSLIEGYANSRALPNIVDPNLPDGADDTQGIDPENWLQAIFNEGTDQSDVVLDDLTTENNRAPYPFENDGTWTDTMYPGGRTQVPGLVFHDRMTVSGTTIGGKTKAMGGLFPCGLIQLNYPTDMQDAILQVHLVPGEHRGYMCTPMTDM